MNDRPTLRIGIINGDLIRGQCMFEWLIFDASIAQRAGGVEPHGLEIPANNLQCRYAALLHCLHEHVARGKGCSGAPESQTYGIGEVLRPGRARRGHVEDAGTRQGILQADAGQSLFGALRLAKVRFGSAGVRHGVRFVEDNHAGKVLAGPVQQLLQP